MAIHRTTNPVKENSQGVLASGARRKTGARGGNPVAAMATSEETSETAQEAAVIQALAEIGEALKERGISLEEIIERGRTIRGQLLEEQYGLEPDTETP